MHDDLLACHADHMDMFQHKEVVLPFLVYRISRDPWLLDVPDELPI